MSATVPSKSKTTAVAPSPRLLARHPGVEEGPERRRGHLQAGHLAVRAVQDTGELAHVQRPPLLGEAPHTTGEGGVKGRAARSEVPLPASQTALHTVEMRRLPRSCRSARNASTGAAWWPVTTQSSVSPASLAVRIPAPAGVGQGVGRAASPPPSRPGGRPAPRRITHFMVTPYQVHPPTTLAVSDGANVRRRCERPLTARRVARNAAARPPRDPEWRTRAGRQRRITTGRPPPQTPPRTWSSSPKERPELCDAWRRPQAGPGSPWEGTPQGRPSGIEPWLSQSG